MSGKHHYTYKLNYEKKNNYQSYVQAAMIPVILFLELKLRILLCVVLLFREIDKTYKDYRSFVHSDAEDINMHV